LQALALPSTLAQRTALHLAAVMTANFNNLLLHWGHRILHGPGGGLSDPGLDQGHVAGQIRPQDYLGRADRRGRVWSLA
ncbi:MAG: hypothetical protein ACKOHH_03105, partial [Bacteroidota bacterium]